MLLPMSKLYGMGVAVRNRMFEWHLLKQHKFDIPVVVVGNSRWEELERHHTPNM